MMGSDEREVQAFEESIAVRLGSMSEGEGQYNNKDLLVLTDGECAKINTKLGVVEGSESLPSNVIKCGCVCGDIIITTNEMGGMRIGNNSDYFRGPEKISALCGEIKKYCFGGSELGTAYCWQLWGSGRLVRKWDAHYKKITCVRSIARGRQLATASDDALIRFWLISIIIDDTISIIPYRTLDGHTLPVTSIISMDPYSPYGRLASVSLDHTLRIWEFTGSLLFTQKFAYPLTALATNFSETTVAVGSATGSIYQYGIICQKETTLRSPHRALISSLVYIATNHFLFSAAIDGTVCIWKDNTPLLVPALSGKPVRALLFASPSSDTHTMPTFLQRQPKACNEPMPLLLPHSFTSHLFSPYSGTFQDAATNDDLEIISSLIADVDALRQENSRWRAVCDALWRKKNISTINPQSYDE
uniref:Uncharacterized protein n=1 Tax=Aureoumbra lagunensis TaxID=44058 RepID=A0A7S3JYA7_9STRA